MSKATQDTAFKNSSERRAHEEVSRRMADLAKEFEETAPPERIEEMRAQMTASAQSWAHFKNNYWDRGLKQGSNLAFFAWAGYECYPQITALFNAISAYSPALYGLGSYAVVNGASWAYGRLSPETKANIRHGISSISETLNYGDWLQKSGHLITEIPGYHTVAKASISSAKLVIGLAPAALPAAYFLSPAFAAFVAGSGLAVASVAAPAVLATYLAYKGLDKDTKIAVRQGLSPLLKGLDDVFSPALAPWGRGLKYLTSTLWSVATDFTGGLARMILKPDRNLLEWSALLGTGAALTTSMPMVAIGLGGLAASLLTVKLGSEGYKGAKRLVSYATGKSAASAGIKSSTPEYSAWTRWLAPKVAKASSAVVYGTFFAGKIGHVGIAKMPAEMQVYHPAVSAFMIAIQAVFLPMAIESEKIISTSPELSWKRKEFALILDKALDQQGLPADSELRQNLRSTWESITDFARDFAPLTNYIDHHVDDIMATTTADKTQAYAERMRVWEALNNPVPMQPQKANGTPLYPNRPAKGISMKDAARIRAIFASLYKDKNWEDWKAGKDLADVPSPHHA